LGIKNTSPAELVLAAGVYVMALKVTYVKSSIGYAKDQKATVRSLGLRKLHQSVVHNDTPAIRGMVFKVKHLVTMEEVEDGSAAAPQVVIAGGAQTYETA
jgi:large subunit ribosomal protein L30